MRQYRTAVGAAATLALVVASPLTASAQDEPVTTVAEGLGGPRQLSEYEDGKLVVAESDTGEVSSVDPETGEVETLVSDLGTAQGVDYGHGRLYIAVGEAGPPPEEGAEPAPPAEGTLSAVLVEATPDGEILRTFDLLEYELENNPDDQVQFVPDEAGVDQPVDALSNPFSVLVQEDRVLVADAGANAVLAVDLESEEISTFFVPETVTDTPECEAAENNPGTVGCDAVPTEITDGPDGTVYVGTLGAEAPGAARVYVLDEDGEEVDVIDGLTSVTGVDVASDGTVYVSNVIEGAPEGEAPPADFDPATVGELTRISPDDERTTADVTMPTGLELDNGTLYASAWSIAAFLGIPDRGEVQSIDGSAFTEADAEAEAP